MPASRWSADELTRLRQFAAEGLPADTIASRLGRSRGAVWTALSRQNLSLACESPAVRQRVIALVEAGWTLTRISRQHGLQVAAIQRLCAVEGVTPRPVRPRPTGRLKIAEMAS